ncbi:MAG: hypothetical protein GY702_04115 [Desulfobulbaceae bacterium]|nr:hypothetical protein [Desulfobulbaceae bacterium]
MIGFGAFSEEIVAGICAIASCLVWLKNRSLQVVRAALIAGVILINIDKRIGAIDGTA